MDVKRAANFDHIFGVGDRIKEEYLFFVPDTLPDKEVSCNGVVPASTITELNRCAVVLHAVIFRTQALISWAA